MKIKVLGCGGSYGVPNVLKGYGECDPNNPKNTRTRSGIIVSEQGCEILIDTPTELRMQLWRAGQKTVDAIVYTHLHADHVSGIDDVKALTEGKKTIPVFVPKFWEETFLKNFYFYLKPITYSGINKEILKLNIVPDNSFDVAGISFLPIKQLHGNTKTLGYRIGDFAYNTDLNDFENPNDLDLLKGIKVWMLGVVTPYENGKHLYLEKALKWIEYIRPERVYLTHMGGHMDYDTLCQTLPLYIRPAYDGMEFEC